MTSYDDDELKKLRYEISTLEEFQQIEILKILEKNNVKYTTNKNGIFLNMKLLPDVCVTQFNEYLLFIKNNNNQN
jgi:hypothetical protein